MEDKNRQNSERCSDVEFRLAAIWQKKGEIDRAVAGYRKVLHLSPYHLLAHLELGKLLSEQGRLQEAISHFRKAVEINPNRAELHKEFIDAFMKQGAIGEAFNNYRLERRDTRKIEINPHDILCCVVVRNEFIRLPYFLSYYRKKGIAKFLIVDNNSTDGTLPYLLEQHDVYTWHSNLSFNQANFGSAWFGLLLRAYGLGHWCIIVDADELLYYPECENKSLIQLCQELDQKNKKAFNAILLDMYSEKAIRDTRYARGQDFLEACPYFDKNFYHTKYDKAGPYKNQTCYFGGVRQRIFGKAGNYFLSKVPLIKYNVDFILADGQHWTNRPETEIASESGCLLHFKYFSTFIDYVGQEVQRKEHYDKAMQYAQYAQVIAKNQALSFYDEGYSIKLFNSQQLVEMGIMKAAKTDFE